MAVKKRLTLCMITKNNEKQLSHCLQQLSGVVDEIIAVDIGSKDQTIDIAKQAGARLYQVKWKDDYSEVKNLCLEQARGRWILFLQPDETIPAEQLKGISLLLDNPNVEGYLLYIDQRAENYRISSPVQSLRLIRNRQEYRYQYKAFERIPDELLSNIKDAGIRIVQQAGPARTRERYALIRLLEEELAEHPQDSYLQYIAGIELLNQKLYEESVSYFQNARQNVNLGYLFAPHLFKCLSWSLISLERHTEALEVLDEGIKYFAFYTDLLVLRGELKRQLKQYGAALRDLEDSLRISEQPNAMAPRPEIDISIILETLGEVHEEVLNYRQALACYRKAYELNTANQKLAAKIGELVKKTASFEALQLMNSGDSEPLGALEYVLWSKGFFKKLEGWIEKVHGSTIKAGADETLVWQIAAKPSQALLSFYHNLGLAKNNINESTLEHEEMTCAEVHREIGDLYAKLKKKREALSAYLRALDWDPLDYRAQEKIWGLFREDSNQFHAFLGEKGWILEGSWFRHQQEFINYILAILHFKNQQFEQAAASFSGIGKDKTSYPLALAYTISSFWLAGKEAEAEKRLDEQNRTDLVFASFLRICQNYALDKLGAGQQRYPYSELIIKEKEQVMNGGYS